MPDDIPGSTVELTRREAEWACDWGLSVYDWDTYYIPDSTSVLRKLQVFLDGEPPDPPIEQVRTGGAYEMVKASKQVAATCRKDMSEKPLPLSHYDAAMILNKLRGQGYVLARVNDGKNR